MDGFCILEKDACVLWKGEKIVKELLTSFLKLKYLSMVALRT